MTKRKVGEETPPREAADHKSPLFSPGLTERQQIALVMKLSGESSHDTFPRPTKIFKTNKHGESPLQIAAIKGDLKQVKMLVRQGAPVNTRDHAGWTPLHEASQKGNLEVCKFLLKHGAHVNAHGYQDETPLHDATLNNHPKVVAVLLAEGANPLLRNKCGKIPVELADNDEIKQLLYNSASKFLIQEENTVVTALSLDSDSFKKGNVVQGQPMERKHHLEHEIDHTVSKSVLHTENKILEHTENKPAIEQIEQKKGDESDTVEPLEHTTKNLDKTPVKRNTMKQPTKLLQEEIEDISAKDDVIVLKEGPLDLPDASQPEILEKLPDVPCVPGKVTSGSPTELEPSPFYRYSSMMPEPPSPTTMGGIVHGPLTLYVARNKRSVKRAPRMESRSPPATRSRAGGKPVDNTETEELKSLNEGRHLLKAAVVTPRKKWLHQHTVRRRHLGDIYESQKRCVPQEPLLPHWITSSMLYTKKYLLQSGVTGQLEDLESHPYMVYLPPIMRVELERMRKENKKIICKHVADKEGLLQQHEQSMLRVRRQALMKHPSPSVCSVTLQQHNFEYSKKLQTVSYDVGNEQLLQLLGEKVVKSFEKLSDQLFKRQKQEADAKFASQSFNWVSSVHRHGLYDMPILGNIDIWVERVQVAPLKPLLEYYEEFSPSDAED